MAILLCFSVSTILECEKECYLERSCSILGTIFAYKPSDKHPTKIRFIYILNHKHLLNVVLISTRNSFAHERMHEKMNLCFMDVSLYFLVSPVLLLFPLP